MGNSKLLDTPTSYQAALLATPGSMLARLHEIAQEHMYTCYVPVLQESLNSMVELRDVSLTVLRDPLEHKRFGAAERNLGRAVSAIERLTRRLEDLRDRCYRFARAALFVEASVRMAESEWPDEPKETPQPPAQVTQPKPVVTAESPEPQTQTLAAGTVEAAPAQKPARPTPASNKQIKAAIRRLASTGASKEMCDALRIQARQQEMTHEMLEQAVNKLAAQPARQAQDKAA